ncbi:MAG: RES domain-containing protein [Acidobacteriota bacterium]
MTRCFRLASSKYPQNSGIGAALYGGRWNPKGVEVIYAAATASLAALEVLVHYSVLPRGFVLSEIRIPTPVTIRSLEVADLSPDWESPTASAWTQAVGRRWAKTREAAVLSVPSTIIASERIYLLNPHHPEFGSVEFLSPTAFQFDPRLK